MLRIDRIPTFVNAEVIAALLDPTLPAVVVVRAQGLPVARLEGEVGSLGHRDLVVDDDGGGELVLRLAEDAERVLGEVITASPEPSLTAVDPRGSLRHGLRLPQSKADQPTISLAMPSLRRRVAEEGFLDWPGTTRTVGVFIVTTVTIVTPPHPQ
jgi:hypothetical protein